MNDFTFEIKKYREKRGLTQSELAQMLNISQTSIAHYEKGLRIPSTQILIKCSDFFNLSLDHLITRVNSNAHEIRLPNKDLIIDQFIRNLRERNESGFYELLAEVAREIEFENLIEDYIRAILVRVGELWERGEISEADEHYSTQLVRRCMYHHYFNVANTYETKKGIALTVQGESHTLGLELVCQYLESKGVRTIYLGTNIPQRSLEQLISNETPDYVFISITMRDHVNSLLLLIEKLVLLPIDKIFIGGQGLQYIKRFIISNGKVQLVNTLNELNEAIR